MRRSVSRRPVIEGQQARTLSKLCRASLGNRFRRRVALRGRQSHPHNAARMAWYGIESRRHTDNFESAQSADSHAARC